MNLKIQYVSDIHAEFHDDKRKHKFKLLPHADIVVFAGDTNSSGGAAAQWINAAVGESIPTFAVLGNHEYYSAAAKLGREERKFRENANSNVRILANSFEDFSYHGSSISIFGGTCWTDWSISSNPEVDKIYASEYMNDYKRIRDYENFKLITPDRTVAEHNKFCAAFLDWAINNKADYKIVVTHHDPLPPSPNDPNAGSRLNGAYHNDFRQMIFDNNLKINTWFSGHTHIQKDTTFENIHFLSNPHGYAGLEQQYALYKNKIKKIEL
jgi:predicted MPP superfamily phosphohydrolase